MIDFKTIEKYAKPIQYPKIIPRGLVIPNQDIVRLLKYPAHIVAKFFETKSENDKRFFLELQCENCNKLFVQQASATDFQSIMSDLRNANNKKYRKPILCNECNLKKEKAIENNRKQNSKDIAEYTELYINSYLNPKWSWAKDISLKDKINSIMQARILDEKTIAQFIQNMDYNDFLNTPYWDAIRIQKLYEANYKCQLCGQKNATLYIHHNTYSHHGYEHHYYKTDLIALCEECHNTFHGYEE